MKVDINKVADNKYMTIPFTDLVNIVFTPDGSCLSCPKKAAIALIMRLERCCPQDGFGNIQTGEINELEAYIVSSLFISRGYNV